jgi:monothiol glutaredoxin
MNEQWKQKIEADVKANKIVVYMRGERTSPRCGFSARVINVLNGLGIDYKTEDMDSDRSLWDTLSALNDWPTSPQIYLNGEFIGGCDILMEMNKNGELKKELGVG